MNRCAKLTWSLFLIGCNQGRSTPPSAEPIATDAAGDAGQHGADMVGETHTQTADLQDAGALRAGSGGSESRPHAAGAAGGGGQSGADGGMNLGAAGNNAAAGGNATAGNSAAAGSMASNGIKQSDEV